MQTEKVEGVGLGERLSEEHLSSGKKSFSRRLISGLVAAVLVIAAFLWYLNSNSGTQYEFVKVTVKDIKESVEITGNVEAGATLNLSFRDSGQVNRINFEPGNKLKANDIIASLKNRDQQLRLDQAEASLLGAQANLNQKIAGYTVEEKQIAAAEVAKAEAAASKVNIDFNNAKEELVLMIKKYAQDEKTVQLMVDDAKSRYDYALKNKTNTGLTQDQSVETARQDLEAQLFLSASQIQQSLVDLKSIVIDDGNSVMGSDYYRLDNMSLNLAKENYYAVKFAFDPLYKELKSGSNYPSDQLKDYAQKEQDMINKLLQAQKTTSDMLAKLPASSTLQQAQITNLKNIILADSSSLSTSLAGLNLKYQTILTALLNVSTNSDSSDSTVSSAQNYYNQQLQNLEQTKIDHQVDLNARQAAIRSLQAQYQIQLAEIDAAKAALQARKVPARTVDLAFLRAEVTADKIAVSLAQEALEKTLLRAPIDGVLSRQNIEVGEDVTIGITSIQQSLFEMISANKLKIDANIAEVDIDKIKIGDKAEITLDAVGDETVFTGTITKIDPVETKIQDVVFYKAEVVIDSNDPRIKPGMTATVNIVLNKVMGVLTVPEKAVQEENGQKYVRILVNKVVKNINVETGIKNLQGDLEIKSGLSEGQEIILRTING